MREAGYAWRETPSDLEVRVPVPPGTKRSELNVALEDHHGRNVWRNEHETSGGAEVVAAENPATTAAVTCSAGPSSSSAYNYIKFFIIFKNAKRIVFNKCR